MLFIKVITDRCNGIASKDKVLFEIDFQFAKTLSSLKEKGIFSLRIQEINQLCVQPFIMLFHLQPHYKLFSSQNVDASVHTILQYPTFDVIVYKLKGLLKFLNESIISKLVYNV